MTRHEIDAAIRALPVDQQNKLREDARAKAETKYGASFWWRDNSAFQESVIRQVMREIYFEQQVNHVG